MEDDGDNKIEEIFDLIKEIKKNNDELKKNRLDSEIINKTKEKGENEKKNYLILKYLELYIVDKKPLEKLMKELKYNELENILNNDEYDDKDLKDKLEELHKNTDFSYLKEEIIKDINVYSTEKEIDEIIKKKKEVILINDSVLKNLDVPYKKYKDKQVYAANKSSFNLIYFPKQNFSILINSSLLSGPRIEENKIKNENNITNNNSSDNIIINNNKNNNDNIPNISSNNFQNYQNNIINNDYNCHDNNVNINKINIPINNQFNNINFNNNNINTNISQNNKLLITIL